jgi:hypothetical protein
MTTQVKAVDQSFRKKWNKAEFEALAAGDDRTSWNSPPTLCIALQ